VQTRNSRPAPAARHRVLKRVAFQSFLTLERIGLHLLPRHFYSSVPDRGRLARHPTGWKRRFGIPAIDSDSEAQLAWLEQCCSQYLHEVAGFSYLPRLDELGIAFRYGYVEGQVLHCVVRSLAPPRIVEVGGGASTVLIAEAVARNTAEGRGPSRISTVDPYAPVELARLPCVEVIRVPAQTVDASIFEELSAGDLLFIDSTHVLKTGSELGRMYLEVLPSLPAGVVIQIHDVYLPYLYSPWVLSDFWDWQESALLAALLIGNPRFEVLCCQSALHDSMPDRLASVLPDYRPLALVEGIDPETSTGHYPSSLWIRSR